MQKAVIIDIVRSPFTKGRPGGALDGIHPVDLYATVLEGLVDRTGIDPGLVEDVITGCVIQVGEQAANIARKAWLAAGLPEHVPGVSLDRKCGSSQQAIDFAAQGVIAGAYDIVVAGGVEMMSRVPMKLNRMDRDDLGDRFRARYPDGLVSQGISAELIATKWGLDRTAVDAYALASHQRATVTQQDGATPREIIPITLPDGTVVTTDEGIRPDTSMEALAGLRTAFRDEVHERRFPDLDWVVTAGNSSQVTDGAVAALITSESVADRLGLTPRAEVTHFAVVGDDPLYMLTGVIPATTKVLGRAGLTADDIDVYEVNEAFASVVLAWQQEIGVEHDRVNVRGGAIAYGHPVGASGGRLMASLLTALEERDGRVGLQVMCESGGMANATIVRRL